MTAKFTAIFITTLQFGFCLFASADEAPSDFTGNRSPAIIAPAIMDDTVASDENRPDNSAEGAGAATDSTPESQALPSRDVPSGN